MTKRTARQDALDTYIAYIGKAREELERINEYIANHGNVFPDDVNWTHVGDVAHINSQLTEIADFIHGTGEYAE